MEEKESPISGSPENTESGSPTPISGGVISAPPETGAGNGGVSGGNTVGSKKRRGRPRKYDADGNLSVAYAARAARSASSAIPVSPPPGFTLTPAFSVAESGPKRGRAKSAASTNFQPFASSGGVFADTAGIDFTPYIITVQTGEDVAAKINSVGQNGQKGPRGVCVLAANGAVSSITIRQPGSAAGGLLTYEGRFEILSLSGSYTMNEANGVTSRNGGLSISLAGPDGRVFGGSVAGWLTAANPIQVVVGSFVPYGYKEQKRKQQRESPTTAAIPAFPDTMPAEIPSQQSVPVVSEVGPPEVAPVSAQTHSEADDRSIGFGHNLNVISPHHTLEWNNGSQTSPQQRIYPDINVSVPGV